MPMPFESHADAFYTNFLTGYGRGLSQAYLPWILNTPLSIEVEALTIFLFLFLLVQAQQYLGNTKFIDRYRYKVEKRCNVAAP